jgi:hypothetical protein
MMVEIYFLMLYLNKYMLMINLFINYPKKSLEFQWPQKDGAYVLVIVITIVLEWIGQVFDE